MSPIHLEIKDHIALVTIDNPPVNATSPTMVQELTEAFDSLWEGEARVAVLTGAGDRAFCAGADIKARAAAIDAPPDRRIMMKNDHGRATRECFNAIYDCPIPVIGAINGAALGAGLALAAATDYIIASEKAVFGLPEIDVGLMGGAKHLSRLFPEPFVRRMHYTGYRATAQEALAVGAIVRVVPHERLMEEAMQDARLIAAKMPIGIRLAKEGLNVIQYMDLKNGYRFEQTRTDILVQTEDAKEAKKAFVERRTPVFKGK